VSGVGKTTLAARVGALAGLPHVEIDALFHGPNWTRLPTFEADVERFSAGPRWITEWQYGSVRDLLTDRADTLIWLHYSRPLATYRVLRRTVRRRVRRETLWNGNQEGPLWTFFTRKDHIVRWSWGGHAKHRARVPELARSRDERSLAVVGLRSPRQTRNWLAGPLAAALTSPAAPEASA
jgi:adenylate kinase family enzyme